MRNIHLNLLKIAVLACLIFLQGPNFCCSQVETPAPEDGLVLWLKLDSDVQDSSGMAYHGTVHNAGFADGIKGQALSLDGTGYVSLPDISNLQLFEPGVSGGQNGSLTIAAWVKAEDVNKYNVICFACGPMHYLSFGITDKNKIRSMVRDTVQKKNYWPTSEAVLQPNTWTHVAFVFEGGKGYKYYINGQLNKEVVNPDIGLYDYGLTNSFIGKGFDAASYFKGLIDEVRVYNKALSESEIGQ